MSAHLPECIHPQRDYPCSWCQEIDCECPCVCDRLRSCEQRVRDEILTAAYESAPAQVRQDEVARLYNIGFADALDAAREAVLAYADDTHQHVGMLKCWPENGDRCDITAALRVAAQRIDDLREDTK